MFKIVSVDNLGRETVAEKLVIVMRSEQTARQICDLINADNRFCDRFHVVKPIDYQLWRGMEDLV